MSEFNFKRMRQKLFLVITLAFLATAAMAQKTKTVGFAKGQIKPTLFGIGFSLSDFNAPKNFGSNSNATTLPIADMSAGVAVSYWKGLTPFIDFSAKLNGIFHDYSAIYYKTPGKTEIGLELEPTINFRPLKDENAWAPYISTGIGLGLYTNHLGSYVPFGAGIQFNASNTTYFMVQAQFKWSITPNVIGNSMFYSIGFAQNIKD